MNKQSIKHQIDPECTLKASHHGRMHLATCQPERWCQAACDVHEKLAVGRNR